MTLPEALPSYTYAARAQSILPRYYGGPYLIFGTRLRPVSAPQFSRLRPLQLLTPLFQERPTSTAEFTDPATIYFCAFDLNEASKTFLCNDMNVTF